MREILPGYRCLVFDSRRYINDKETPIEVTFRPATVVRRYGSLMKEIGGHKFGPYPDLVDVIFDGEEKISRGHFTQFIKEL